MVRQNDTESALLEAVRGLLPSVSAASGEIEQLGHLTPEIHEALIELGVYRMWVPASLGGLEVGLLTGIRVYESLATADGATAWTAMLGGGAGRFAAFLDGPVAEQIFGQTDAFVAGSASPSGTARPVDGGYVVNGRWKYGSGSHHATWFTANCLFGDGSDEEPRIRSVAVPVADVRIHPTWSVTAMSGTGSEDFEIRDVFVPEDHTFSLMTDSPREPGPLYRLPFMSVAELSFGAVSAGIGRGALDSFATLARTKTPTGSDRLLRENAEVAATYGRAEASVRSASVYVHHSAHKIWKAVLAGEQPGRRLRIDARLAAVDAAARCARAIDRLHKRSGMDSLYGASAFGRAWRDLNAATQNLVVGFERYGAVGGSLLEAE